MSKRIHVWRSLSIACLSSTRIRRRQLWLFWHAKARRLIGTLWKVVHRLMGRFEITVGLLPWPYMKVFSVQAGVIIPISPNGQGTSSQWTHPFTYMRPKKGNRISCALKNWSKKFPWKIVADLDLNIRGEPCELCPQRNPKVQKPRTPDLWCNGYT